MSEWLMIYHSECSKKNLTICLFRLVWKNMFLQWKNSEGCFASGRSTEDEIIQNFLIDSSLGTSQSQETWLWLQPSKRNCLHILEEYFLLNILPAMETVINVWLFRYLFHIKGPMVSLWRDAIFCQGNAFEWNNEGNNPASSCKLSFFCKKLSSKYINGIQ